MQTAGAKGPALLALSGKDLIVRYTQVPPVPDWRLEMLMNFEIQEVSEQSGGDVSAAYKKLEVGDTSSGDNVVLVALAKNGYLKPRLEALKAAGLDVLGGCPRSVGSFWAYKENGKLGFDETVFLMHIGHENTDVTIVRNGELLFARNVSGGSRLFTDAIVQNMRVDGPTAEKLKVNKGNLTPRGKAKYRDSAEEKVANSMMQAAGHLVSAFNSSVMFAKAQTKVPDCQPDRLVLMGGGALLKGLPEYLESNLGVPVELFDPFSSIDLGPLSEEAANALRQDQGAMAATLGLAQMAADPDAFRVEVLPEADRKRRRFLQHTALTIASGVLLAAALVVSWVMMSSASSAGVSEATVLAEKKKTYQSNLAEFERARTRVETINDQKFKLRQLVSLEPAYVLITDIVHDVVNGVGPDGRSVGLGFDEIWFPRVGARFAKMSVANEKTGQTDVFEVPEVAFEGKVIPIGGRQPVNAYTDFVTALRGAFERAGGLAYTFEALGKEQTFKFTVRQTMTPEKVAAARKAEAAANAAEEPAEKEKGK